MTYLVPVKLEYDGMSRADSEILARFESLPLLKPSFFSTSWRLGQLPRMAAKTRVSTRLSLEPKVETTH